MSLNTLRLPQLIKLHAVALADGSFIEVLESYPNIGPIVDFCVADLAKQGQSQLVTCSGSGVDGSLRLITNGIGIWEMAASEMPGVEGGLSKLPYIISPNFSTSAVVLNSQPLVVSLSPTATYCCLHG